MPDYPLLSTIKSPQDIKKLPRTSLPQLAQETRDFLVAHVSQNGGHLASNLGVVELTIALHRVFDSPTDHIIWDVGHQSYVHKLYTGRREMFETLRQVGGLSGFTRRDESVHDPFGAGHSSTALSAALGLAQADKLQGKAPTTVAVIGDGAFTGGMVHEALNNCDKTLPLIAILNENQMSISPTTGAFANYLARLRSSASYYKMKRSTAKVLNHLPLIGKPLYKLLLRTKIALKQKLYHSNYYEDLGFFYMGPLDGHDIEQMERALREAQSKKTPVLLHIKTKKGKGYTPAEDNPDQFHSVYPNPPTAPTYHAAFGEWLCHAAEKDTGVTAICAAMGEGTGLHDFADQYPTRFYDVGIAEEHAVTFAAGLAAGGIKPFVAIYSTFFQRAYDQILHDVALQDLPVRLVIDRAGLASGDGPTHHGIFDVAFLSQCPNMHIYTPATLGSMRIMLDKMLQKNNIPTALRYPNEAENEETSRIFYPNNDYDTFGVKTDTPLDDTISAAIVTYGTTVSQALLAKAKLKELGVNTIVVLIEQLTPFDVTASKVLSCLPPKGPVVFLEEGVKHGGVATSLLADMVAISPSLAERYYPLAIEFPFASPKTPCDLREFHHISPKDVVETIMAHLA